MIVLGCYILATAIGGWQFNFLYALGGFIADMSIVSVLKANITVNTTDIYSRLVPLWYLEEKLSKKLDTVIKALSDKIKEK